MPFFVYLHLTRILMKALRIIWMILGVLYLISGVYWIGYVDETFGFSFPTPILLKSIFLAGFCLYAGLGLYRRREWYKSFVLSMPFNILIFGIIYWFFGWWYSKMETPFVKIDYFLDAAALVMSVITIKKISSEDSTTIRKMVAGNPVYIIMNTFWFGLFLAVFAIMV